MKIFHSLLTIILASLVFSCGPSEAEELKALKNEVMDVHDAVMPKMGDMMKIRKGLMGKAETHPDSVMLLELADQVDQAHEGMMQWMRNYEPEFTGSNEEVREYLEGQMKAIQKVSDEMNGAIKAGQEALEKQ